MTTIWDDEHELTHWTPEEIVDSNVIVARIGEIIQAEHLGYITHDEAMIQHLMLDPDLLEFMLDDAYGNAEKTKCIHEWYKEAKSRANALSYA